MICPSCEGLINEENPAYCPRCGVKLTSGILDEPRVSAQPPSPPLLADATPQSNSTKTANEMKMMLERMTSHVAKKHSVVFLRVPDQPLRHIPAFYGNYCLTCKEFLDLIAVPPMVDEVIKKGPEGSKPKSGSSYAGVG